MTIDQLAELCQREFLTIRNQIIGIKDEMNGVKDEVIGIKDEMTGMATKDDIKVILRAIEALDMRISLYASRRREKTE